MPAATNLSDRRWMVDAADVGMRLDKFLAAAERLGSRSKAVSALERGKVFVNDHEVSLAEAAGKVGAGDEVRVWMDRPGSSRAVRPPAPIGDLQIVHEDDELMVLNKPPGLLAVPLAHRESAASVFEELAAYLAPRKRRPFVVHRIDRDTSGLVLFAKNPRAQQALKAQFLKREPERVYLAAVYGVPSPSEGEWRDHLVWDTRALIQKETSPRDPAGKEAVSAYRVVESFGATSLLEVRLETGKRNQIRIQARLRGHTLIGEQRYVYGPDSLRPIAFKRQALHAWRLGFLHPSDGRPLAFEAPLPDDFAQLLGRLRQHSGAGRPSR